MLNVKKILATTAIAAMMGAGLTGCGTKATGGGWIPSASGVDGEKATFGFSAQLVGDPDTYGISNAKGNIQINDHGTGFKFHADVDGILTMPGVADSTAYFTGTAKDGTPVTLTVEDLNKDQLLDSNDRIQILVGSNPVYSNAGTLQGGNITVK